LDKFITALIINIMEMRLITTLSENVARETPFGKEESLRKIAYLSLCILAHRWNTGII
jgi:hypothetical protein